jgi:outer membrane protein TolC
MLKGKWWEIYQDPQLDSLENRIDSSNVQLRQAMELYLAAEAQVRAARANLYPTLSAGPSISRDRVSAHRPLATSGGATTYGDFTIAGQASWEPDFWGRIRRTVEQARENAQASAADELSRSMRRWPPTISLSAASIPRSSSLPTPWPTSSASST